MRKFHSLVSFIFVGIMFSACGHDEQKPIRDDPYDRTMDVARDALYYNRLKQSEINYAKAFELALAKDDKSSLNNSGYNLATVQLALNEIDKAEKTLYKTRQELYIRGQLDSKQLDLLQGVCLYRRGLYHDAIGFIHRASTSEAQDIKQRSIFLMGLLYDRLHDNYNLQRCIEKLATDTTLQDKNNPSANADLIELRSLYSLSQGDYQRALTQAQDVESVRRQQNNFKAMIRALTLQAKIYLLINRPQEAVLCYLRAGESAKHMQDPHLAKFYYDQAALQSNNYPTYQITRTKIQELQNSK